MRSGRGRSSPAGRREQCPAQHPLLLHLTPLPCQLFSRPGPRSTCACRPRQPLIPSEQLACIARSYSCDLPHHQEPAMDGSWMGSSPQASIDHPAPAGPASLRGTGGVSGGIYSGSPLPPCAARRRRSRLQMQFPLEDDLWSCSSRGSCWAVTVPAQPVRCTTTLFAETGIYSSSSASHAGAGPPAAGRPSYAGQPYVRHRRRALLLHAFRSVSCPSEHSARCVQ